MLLQSGYSEDYDLFREWAFDRFGDSADTVWIRRLVHVTLLTPPDEKFMRRMEPLKEKLKQTEFDPKKLERGWPREAAIWRAFGLALLEYRLGNFENSRVWAEQALAFRDSRKHISAVVYPVLAMARYRGGDVDAAKMDLKRARQRIEEAFTPELPAAYEPMGKYQGYWWDWIIARVLFKEAEALVEPAAGVRR